MPALFKCFFDDFCFCVHNFRAIWEPALAAANLIPAWKPSGEAAASEAKSTGNLYFGWKMSSETYVWCQILFDVLYVQTTRQVG